MLGVEIDGPGPVHFPVRTKTEGVQRKALLHVVAHDRAPSNDLPGQETGSSTGLTTRLA